MTFWRLGFEGASIADLTQAMGITPQSLYAAFTSKAELYREAIGWYQARIGGFTVTALEQPDVMVALEGLLAGAAVEFSNPTRPQGCMISTAVLVCADENRPIAEMLARERDGMLDALMERIARGIAAGQLAPDTDAKALARFVGAIIQGMSVQARDGAETAELESIAAIALAQLRRYAIAG
ncbi:TetR family transcriptional regulator [Kaistia sp. 32K]|uniref:TetR/AcrR family transcriptional regulator n=1 Tax=Kaistia sp. 32K TaxID=2795690 RepID=UPI001916918C|nr:TetR/AcrR family transcriptional regulator [Kaistia sp. 32K]BCP53524.1 TetR family transcriptional regulator [Kaistia sp. 32K]